MAGRVVVFGATGYTGRLVAEALVARGVAPVLAGRSAERLGSVAGDLGGAETVVADVSRPDTVSGLVGPGDVLVSTVGPFARWGDAAAQAAVAGGAHYLDSTGEGAFIRRVFERFGPEAQAAGCGLLTAFGADWVPGNLAGGLALREAGPGAARVEIGYFLTGSASAGSMSGGTRASSVGAMLDPGFAWRDGQIVTERGAARRQSFSVHASQRDAVSVAGSEHFALPRLAPHLREVDVYLGWFGALSRPVQALSLATSALTRVPSAREALDSLASRFIKGSSGGPDAAQRARSGLHVIAVARDGAGSALAEVRLEGPNAYTFTGNILAWGAHRALDGELRGTGALGPVDGFGLDQLQAGCAEVGLSAV